MSTNKTNNDKNLHQFGKDILLKGVSKRRKTFI